MTPPRRPRWRTVATIFRRELRDQVRDRRTLFMVFVLPLLLYPLLGIGVLQLSTAFEAKPRLVVVVGAEHLPGSPPLLSPGRDGFDPSLFSRPADAERLRVKVAGPDSPILQPGAIRSAIQGGLADAVMTIPPDIQAKVGVAGSAPIPIQYDSTFEPSQVTYLRVREVVERWRDAIVQARLARDHKPPDYTEPVAAEGADVAPAGEAGGSIWGRLFPFLLVVMALTGAFYPAIDLCAGEKERGTMETLLLSPAGRTEIVLGKFLTVMVASITTALLNLVSMGLTGLQIAGQVAAMSGTRGARMGAILAPPHLSSYFWMMLLLIPLAAFFSALCVALAVLARSMKEGQYYMTPLYLVSLPLILVTLAPEIKLDLFFSLVPITGASLLLKTLILGEYATARRYFLPVLIPTMIYAAIALRWAVDLFRREDVIFRESEVFDLRLWLRQLVRDREARPGAGSALFCFAVMISLTWFVSQATLGQLSMIAGLVVSHGVAILGPPVALAFLLTSDPAGTLRVRARPQLVDLLLAGGIALAIHPALHDLAAWVGHVFPMTEGRQALLKQLTDQIPNAGVGILVLAAMPAITEEFAFRGYIQSGLLRAYRPATAVLLSAFLFAFLHALISLFQQFFPAALLGLILGTICYRTGSLWPGVVLHLVNNTLGVVVPDLMKRPGLGSAAGLLLRDRAEGLFRLPIVAGGLLLAGVLLALLCRGRAPGPATGSAESIDPLPA